MKIVSIHIVTHDNENTIAACLQSVFKQKYKNIDLFVIDNASTDSTVAIAKKMGARCILLSKNIGYSAAHNKGIKLTKSDFIVTLNPDVVLEENYIKEIIKAFKEKNIGSVQSLLYRTENLRLRTRVIDSAGLYLNVFRRQKLRYENKKENSSKSAYIFGPDGAAACYRRKMLQDVAIQGEVFDEDFFMHKEDVDLAWRAQLRDWKSVYEPKAVAYHIRTFRAGRRQNIDNTMKMLAVRNRYFLLLKNEIFVLFLRDFFWITLYDIGILLYIFFREQSSFPAYVQVLRYFPTMCKKRMAIQRTRKVSTVYMSRWFVWRQA